jgi:hypothetical protein
MLAHLYIGAVFKHLSGMLEPAIDGRSVILLCKRERFSAMATEIAKTLLGARLRTFSGTVGDPLPAPVERGAAILISFLSPWIVPARILDRCGLAINFHPGSVDYPGTGCYNFALYEDAGEFGATCHHMLPKVDTGPVIEERRLPIFPADTVETLKLRTMVTMLAMFQDIATSIAQGSDLPVAKSHWTRRAFTRREMNALKRLTDDMPRHEVERRIRATIYPGYDGPYYDRDGRCEMVPVPERAAIA